MIRDQEEFEQSLEDAVELLARQTTLDEGERSRLNDLLASISEYRPRIDIHPEDPLRARLDALAAHLDAFERRRDENTPEPGSLLKGRGSFIFPG